VEIFRFRKWVPTVSCILAVAFAPAVRAGELYFSGDVRISGGFGDSSGSTPFFDTSGSDSDSSPVFGGAFGFATPMNRMFPDGWELDLPSWVVRTEVEGLGGRDYELTTEGADPVHSDVTSWSLMQNVWLDIPLREPITWALGRVPILEPLSFQLGAGVGFGSNDVDVTDNVFTGSETAYNFVYQAGAGLGYALTESVTFSVGYRYVDLGEVDVSLSDGPNAFGNFTLDLSAHEVATTLRVHFYPVPLPWSER